jgi:cystathionine beta-lyase family protein involved in aluminum resistance
MLTELKEYFKTTPREKVLENWAKSESFDEIGPTMDEFIKNNNKIINMTNEDKISYMQVAASVVGYSMDKKGLESLVTIYDKVLEKKGQTDLSDLVDIQISIDRKYKAIENGKNK